MKTFGDMGVVKCLYGTMNRKLFKKGLTMIFCGYSLSHGSHVYSMFNMKMNKICTTRYITWLGKMYGQWSDNECIDTKEGVNFHDTHCTYHFLNFPNNTDDIEI